MDTRLFSSLFVYVFLLIGMACRCLMLSGYWEIDLKYHWSNTTGGIVYTLTGRKLSQTDCAAVCMYNSDCLMFGYSKVTGTCHGFRYLEHSPVSILEESQVIYKHTQCCHLRGYIWMEDGPLCVKVHNNRSTWDNAKTQCEQDHGRLAILDDAKKYQAFINYGNMDFISTTILDTPGVPITYDLYTPGLSRRKTGGNRIEQGTTYEKEAWLWLGISDQETEGSWVWLNGADLDTSYWTSVLLNDYSNEYKPIKYTADCGATDGHGNLIDVHCRKKLSYLCQRIDLE